MSSSAGPLTTLPSTSVAGSPSPSSTSPSSTDPSSSSPLSSSIAPPTTPTTTSSSSSASSSSLGPGTETTSTTPNAPTFPTSSSKTTPPVSGTAASSTIYASSVLTQPSTSVYEASSTVTSDGQVYTTQISVTTVLAPGSVVTSAITTTSKSSSSNTAPIVGGVVGGIAVIGLLGLLCYFLFNKKRRLKDEFDGNFDPLAVSHNKHSPHPSLGATAAVNNPSVRQGGATLPQVNVEDDDGMGGRLARGAGGGGVISPYPFASPPNQPLSPSQMSQYGQGGRGAPPGAMMALGAGSGAYNDDKQGHHRNMSSLSSPASIGTNSSSPAGAYYGGATSPGLYGYQGQPGQVGQHLQGQGLLQPSPTNTSSSGGGGQGYANNNNNNLNPVYNPYAPLIGRGPSPGPSVGNKSDTMSQSQYTSSSVAGGSGGGVGVRTSKEIEALGGNLAAGGGGMMGLASMPIPHVFNPDESQDGPIRQQGRFGQSNYYGPSSSTTVQPTNTFSQSSKPGLITLAPSPSLVQHQDGGRVDDQTTPEAQPNEIPPAYDSLPDDVRR